VTVERLRSHDGRIRWIDAVDPTDEELACLETEFGLHPLALEDVRKHAQRPKLEQYPNHSFLVAKSAALQEVDLFWGDDWLVSVRERDEDGATWPADAARRRFERAQRQEATTGFLVYLLLDELVDGYFVAVDLAEDRLEAIEDDVFGARERTIDETEVQQRLFDIRRELLLFRRAVTPLRDVVAALMRDGPLGFDDDTRTHLQDVYDHVLRVVDLVDAQRELMGNAVDAHLAIISNRMNQVMKTMTSWGAILLGATLVAGIYGMNFDHMPELGWTFGYPMALGIMAAITVVGFWYFRRKDWL
jgi:magnesium transporter